MSGWVWLAVAAVLVGAGLAMLALSRRRAAQRGPASTLTPVDHELDDWGARAIPGLLGPSEAPPLFKSGPTPPGYRPGQQEDPS